MLHAALRAVACRLLRAAFRPLGALALAALLSGCGETDTRRVTLRRMNPPGGGCPAPTSARQLRVSALGDFAPVPFSDVPERGLAIDLFPPQTRALAVEVLGTGGALLAVGRTGTLSEGDLADGRDVPVFVAPPRGFCPVGSMAEARVAPLVARAGAGVLVAGGANAEGGPVAAAELYDPARGSFEPAGDGAYFDLRGGAVATLADGRVLLVWENGFQLYDPAARAFGPPTFPNAADVRVHASSQIALLPDGRVLVAGGCAASGARAPCAAAADAQIFDPATARFVAARPLVVPRAAGHAFLDEAGRVWLLGGYGADGAPATQAELWDPAGGSIVVGPLPAGAAAPLPAGGLLLAFAPADAAPDDAASVLPPMGAAVVDRDAPGPRAGASLTPLEDGVHLVLGGVPAAAPGPEAILYRPHDGEFEALAAAPSPPRTRHGAVRLDDGSVLVVGGAGPSGEPLADAWLYRHDLTGPWSSVLPQTFREEAPLVVPGHPTAVRVAGEPPALIIAHAWDAEPLTGWVVLSGPRYAAADVAVTLSADDGVGAAVLFGWNGPGDYLAAIVEPGRAPALLAVERGRVTTVCAGSGTAAPLTPSPGLHALELVLRIGRATLRVDGEERLSCAIDPTVRGGVGIGRTGAAAGDLRVAVLTATRPGTRLKN